MNTKEHVLRMYNNNIDSAEAEISELREKLDNCMDYLGQMRKLKWELENNAER